MARPRKGTEARKLVAIRLEPSEKKLLIKQFGGVQAAIDQILTELKMEEALKKELRKTDPKPDKFVETRPKRTTWTENQKQLRKELKPIFPNHKISRNDYGGITVGKGNTLVYLNEDQQKFLRDYECHFHDFFFDVDKKKERPD